MIFLKFRLLLIHFTNDHAECETVTDYTVTPKGEKLPPQSIYAVSALLFNYIIHKKTT
jgi:hypothetical protein